MRLAARVERDGEERVRGFRLAVCNPLVVWAALEVRIVEVDPAAGVTSRRQSNDARALGLSQRGPESRRELKVAEVVGRELGLEPASISRERRRHDARIVHENVERAA